MCLYAISTALACLEKQLGNVLDENNVFSYQQIVACDEQEDFPEAACQQLNAWGLSHYYVPAAWGGKLTGFDQLILLMKLVARRDLTIAIAHGKTFLGASPIWVAGSDEQKRFVSRVISAHYPVALGLTEKAHGSDLLANDVIARVEAGQYRISGQKWLINNATRGRLMTLLARTDECHGARAHSLLLVDKHQLEQPAYRTLKKIKTHGIRGADISGIEFDDALVDSATLIGKAGQGLEITLKSLQISRTLCCSLSLGALDSALRTTTKFALNRVLYQTPIIEIAHVRETLAEAYAHLLVNEALAIVIARCLQAVPEQMSLYAAVAKYRVPKQTDRVIYELSWILGARHYLREAHDSGVFQKIMRDNLLVGLFDGSTVVNAQWIADQLPAVFRKLGTQIIDPETCSQLFDLTSPLPAFRPEKLSLTCRGQDLLMNTIEGLFRQISQTSALYPPLLQLVQERDELQRLLQAGKISAERLSLDAEALIWRYTQLIAGACVVNLIKHNASSPQFRTELLSVILAHLWGDSADPAYPDRVDFIIKQLVADYQSDKVFSVINWSIR